MADLKLESILASLLVVLAIHKGFWDLVLSPRLFDQKISYDDILGQIAQMKSSRERAGLANQASFYVTVLLSTWILILGTQAQNQTDPINSLEARNSEIEHSLSQSEASSATGEILDE